MSLPALSRPLVFFDLETTGLFPEIDRIIEIGLIKVSPDGTSFRLTQRFDPEMRIPAESTAIHGIRNEDLRDEPLFGEMAHKLFDLFSDADMGGFALHRLDIPILTKELGRAGLGFSMEGRRVVDASIIYREKERRNLTAAYRFYCGKDLLNAHGAEADNDATYEVFLAQLARYPDLPQDLEGLHTFCRKTDPGNVDREGKLVWRDGEAYFNFGKQRYKALAEVVNSDRDYLDWIINKGDFSPEFTEICRQARRGVFPKRVTPITAKNH